MIQVRKVQPDDLKYLYEHAEELYFNSETMTTKLEHMSVVLDGGEIAGIGFSVKVNEICLLNWIFVKEDKRRERLGTMLVKTMLSVSEQQGAVQALMPGTQCEFPEFLGFDKLSNPQTIREIEALYAEKYQSSNPTYYQVSLIDYFKPCSCKK